MYTRVGAQSVSFVWPSSVMLHVHYGGTQSL